MASRCMPLGRAEADLLVPGVPAAIVERDPADPPAASGVERHPRAVLDRAGQSRLGGRQPGACSEPLPLRAAAGRLLPAPAPNMTGPTAELDEAATPCAPVDPLWHRQGSLRRLLAGIARRGQRRLGAGVLSLRPARGAGPPGAACDHLAAGRARGAMRRRAGRTRLHACRRRRGRAGCIAGKRRGRPGQHRVRTMRAGCAT